MAVRVIKVRRYGSMGPWVVLIHGGPGAPGMMAPLARGLEDDYRVLEPFQRGSGGEPLTVARHVADLDELVGDLGADARPALVGSSWGAMLALAYAAAHPDRAGPLVLVGCGTFDPESRDRLRATIEARQDAARRERLSRLSDEIADPDQRLLEKSRLLFSLYVVDPVTTDQELAGVDARAHRETWEDMIRLQDEGVLPAALAGIDSPVLMLHGDADPHPGPMIRDSLLPYLPRLEYHEWERCGHYPWLERAVRDDFFVRLRDWLRRRLGG